MNVFVPEGSRARASSRTRLSSASMICAGRIALNSEKSSAFDDPRLPRPAMNSRIRWRNKRPVRLARPFARTASTVRETIVENASSTPWPVRALVRNIGAAGNSFRSQAVSSGPIAIESARHRTGDLRHDLHPVLDQVEGVRPLDVADGEDALGAEEERLREDLADGVLAH